VSIHREGYPTLTFVGLTLAVMNLLTQVLSSQNSLLWITLPVSLGILGFFAWFFRNPERTIPLSINQVISPADGKIVAIERVRENEYFQDDRLKISIYMSALNVHVNRIPLTGEVCYVKYHPGKYLVAFHPKSSELNERSTIVIADAEGKQILIRQIAGFLARRIVTYSQVQQAVTVGEELGFIKFGSRCDVFLPPDTEVFVNLDQHVRGGETVIAQLSSSED
jgi:phosphatidylserine decarboxylase